MLLVLIDQDYNVIYQFAYHNMYLPTFKYAIFIDNTPNFNIKFGNGRILMNSWNKFLRIIKKKRFNKLKQKKIVKFWKNERKQVLYSINLKINEDIINNILLFINPL